MEHDSEEAFATLVTRHIDKVYSVALRHTRNPHQAEEITQAVFVLLARKSNRLGKRVILEGWLYQTARLTSLALIRGEIRRARREQEAYMQTISNEDESDVWKQIAPLLDAAMASLNETDRHALVLRFFYGKSMKEIGAALGGSEDAATLRLHRAVEKLRQFLLKRGIASTTDIIAGAISTNSVQVSILLPLHIEYGNGISKGFYGEFENVATKAELVIDAEKMIPLNSVIKVDSGTVEESFSDYTEVSPGSYVPLSVMVKNTSSPRQFGEMVFAWTFKLHDGLWLFDESQYRGKKAAWTDRVVIK